MPRVPNDTTLYDRLSAFVSARGQRRSAAARDLGLDKALIHRVLRSKGAVIEATRFKLTQALDRADGKSSHRVMETQQPFQLTEPLPRLALEVAQFIAGAVEQRVAPTKPNGAR